VATTPWHHAAAAAGELSSAAVGVFAGAVRGAAAALDQPLTDRAHSRTG
jgi:hypothetical protein